MNKINFFNNKLFTLFICLITLSTHASNIIDDSSYSDGGPPLPPTEPIDSYLILATIVCVVFAAVYFYKSKKAYNDEYK